MNPTTIKRLNEAARVAIDIINRPEIAPYVSSDENDDIKQALRAADQEMEQENKKLGQYAGPPLAYQERDNLRKENLQYPEKPEICVCGLSNDELAKAINRAFELHRLTVSDSSVEHETEQHYIALLQEQKRRATCGVMFTSKEKFSK